jgi:hypothetical protein
VSSARDLTGKKRAMQKLAMFKEKALAYGDPEAKLDEVQPLKGELKSAINMDSLGDPWGLLLSAGTTIARQCMTLGLILFSVMTSHEYLMSCDTRKLGDPPGRYLLGDFCEYSKAYVRCFPILAVVVTLIVSSRQILQHRMYYQMLRHGMLLDIENFSAFSDPLFWIVVWCALNAFLHFAVNVIHSLGSVEAMKSDSFMEEVETRVVFFVMPACLYLAFLYGSYDTEATLMPLSKYFEELGQEQAQDVLGKMPFIPETAVAAAVQRDLCPLGSRAHLPETAEEAYALLQKKALQRAEEAKRDPEAEMPLSRWRLVSTMWPGQFLLNSGLSDPESVRFRMPWYIFCSISFCVMGAAFVAQVSMLWDKTADVVHGQAVDSCGVAVTAAFAGTNLWLAWCFLKNVTVSCRT